MSYFKNYIKCHKDSTIFVLGLGTSLLEFEKYKNDNSLITIGVNDISQFIDPTYLLCLDSPSRFKEDRRKTIMSNGSKNFITHLVHDWKFPDKNVIEISIGKRKLEGFESNGVNNKINISNNSTYVACILAYYMGAKNIGLLGCDFTMNHYNKEDGKHTLNNRLKEIEFDFKQLYEKLHSKGCELYNISSTSVLKSMPKKNIDSFYTEFCCNK